MQFCFHFLKNTCEATTTVFFCCFPILPRRSFCDCGGMDGTGETCTSLDMKDDSEWTLEAFSIGQKGAISSCKTHKSDDWSESQPLNKLQEATFPTCTIFTFSQKLPCTVLRSQQQKPVEEVTDRSERPKASEPCWEVAESLRLPGECGWTFGGKDLWTPGLGQWGVECGGGCFGGGSFGVF